ncbi:hypothetical protein [Indiicoccus explosivorum]|uniref:hypothetical protein n=1 Tax=Indiicoccus explosivorum TaxID=1917864 RepID=UPI000B437A3B|nr:hypothetical protein [Indiicoccus explosivorum]
MVGKMITLQEQSFQAFFDSPHAKRLSRLVLLLVGVGYGAISIASNADYISSFESALLRNALVPLIFLLFGVLTAWLTKLGFSLLLWAGAKSIGGKGLLRQISLAVPVVLIPGLLAVPFLTGSGFGSPVYLPLLAVGLLWMYLISARVVQAVEGFTGKKAYIAASLALIFLASVYYLVVPS